MVYVSYSWPCSTRYRDTVRVFLLLVHPRFVLMFIYAFFNGVTFKYAFKF